MGTFTLDKFIQGILPLLMVLKNVMFFIIVFFLFTSDSCVQVLYTKNYNFATKIAYVQDKIFPQSQEHYICMLVTQQDIIYIRK